MTFISGDVRPHACHYCPQTFVSEALRVEHEHTHPRDLRVAIDSLTPRQRQVFSLWKQNPNKGFKFYAERGELSRSTVADAYTVLARKGLVPARYRGQRPGKIGPRGQKRLAAQAQNLQAPTRPSAQRTIGDALRDIERAEEIIMQQLAVIESCRKEVEDRLKALAL